MKKSLIYLAVVSTSLSMASSTAMASGIDGSGIIMENGNVVEISNVSVSATVTGTVNGSSTSTGDVAPNYSMSSVGLRMAVNDKIGLALVQDSPFGKHVQWLNDPIQLAATKGKLSSDATSVIGSYTVGENARLFAGLRQQSVKADIAVTAVNQYQLSSDKSTETGYVLGAGFEKPEIGMKMSLTYHTKVKHSIKVTESHVQGGNRIPGQTSTMEAYMPSSIKLNFQTGIAKNTLLFGSIKRVNWTETELKPNHYNVTMQRPDPLLSYKKDDTIYNLGLGYRFNENWSAAVTYGVKPAKNENGKPLGPTDGFKKIGLGVTYKMDNLSFTLATQEAKLGDTDVYLGANKMAIMTNNKSRITALKIKAKF